MTAFAHRSFSAGEISPSLYSRVDLVKYQTGLRTCRNNFIKKNGGAFNRAGTKFITEVKDSSRAVRLIEFVFNNNQTYILEFGNAYIRFIKDDALVEVSGVSAWVTSTAYVVGDLVVEGGVNYYCTNAHTSSGANQPPNASFWYALTGNIYEIPTTYQEADLMELRYVQNADVMTIVHDDYGPRDLARFADTNWTLTPITWEPSIATPDNVTNGGAVGATTAWKVSAISESKEESLPSVATTSGTVPSTTPVTITWDAVTDAVEYEVYRLDNGIYSSIGTTETNSFIDNGIESDPDNNPVNPRDPFSTNNNFPLAITYYQQRLFLGAPKNEPETIHASRTGSFKNFTFDRPATDAQALFFTLVSNQVNQIQHMIDLGTLIVFTSSGEWSILGGESGIITPSLINAKKYSYNGIGTLRPLVINETALYVQNRGSIVRDIKYNFDIDGYTGNDLTIFSNHLFEGYTMADWAYQRVPNSMIWSVRSDGTVLGLTYLREQEIIAWHRHDFENGIAENVNAIPDGDEDSVFFVIRRVINGSTVRYIEKMNTRNVTPSTIKDATFLDSYLTFDGRNTTATTMTLTGGTNWTSDETLTLTASASFFLAGDIGNQIHISDDSGDTVRLTITGFTSATIVSVKSHKTVPLSIRGDTTTNWAEAVDELSGLDHLEGQNVSVFADGFVIASPNNAVYDVITVSGGAITLPVPRTVIHVGLPITSDLETLDIDTAQSESLIDKNKHLSHASLIVESTRGLWIGPKPPTDDAVDPLENLTEFKIRNEENYDDPVAMSTGTIDVNFVSEWNNNGRIFVRQVDPLPSAVLAIIPSGRIPFRG